MDSIRLNKFMAHAGVATRRECEQLIKKGLVKVNGKQIFDLGLKVSLEDKVEYNNERLFVEKKVYLLVNKPKSFVFESKDDKELNICFLIRKFPERMKLDYTPKLFPVLPIVSNDCGLVLISNDEELKTLFDVSSSVKKMVYSIALDKEFSNADSNKLLDSKDLAINASDFNFIDENKKIIGIKIELRNENKLKLFIQALGYRIEKWDRVLFDFLSKKNLPRGKWRVLEKAEIIKLKHLKY